MCMRYNSVYCEKNNDNLNRFTIHGLWMNSDKGHLTYCTSDKFNINLLDESLLKQLEYNMPTLIDRNTHEHFLAHEFEKVQIALL